jgi:hypothetical protein
MENSKIHAQNESKDATYSLRDNRANIELAVPPAELNATTYILRNRN